MKNNLDKTEFKENMYKIRLNFQEQKGWFKQTKEIIINAQTVEEARELFKKSKYSKYDILEITKIAEVHSECKSIKQHTNQSELLF